MDKKIFPERAKRQKIRVQSGGAAKKKNLVLSQSSLFNPFRDGKSERGLVKREINRKEQKKKKKKKKRKKKSERVMSYPR